MAEPSSRSSATASLPGRSSRTAATQLLTCDAVATEAERRAHFRIRHQVFVIEQGMFGGSYGGAGGAAATTPTCTTTTRPRFTSSAGRTRPSAARSGSTRSDPTPDPTRSRWKGDRLAVLASHRHLGLGAPLVRFAVSSAARLGGREMEAFIQPANIAFFRWLGWRRTGDLVDYAGLPHQRMLIDLTSQT